MEVPELLPSGRVHVQRIYVGPYFQATVSEQRWILQKWSYILLTAASFLLYFGFAYRSVPANKTAYVTICQALSLFGYIFLGWFALERLLAPRLMERRKHREAVADLRLAASLLTVMLGCCALTTLIHFFLSGRDSADLAQVAAFTAAGICTLAICVLEKRILYTRVPNKGAQMGEEKP